MGGKRVALCVGETKTTVLEQQVVGIARACIANMTTANSPSERARELAQETHAARQRWEVRWTKGRAGEARAQGAGGVEPSALRPVALHARHPQRGGQVARRLAVAVDLLLEGRLQGVSKKKTGHERQTCREGAEEDAAPS